MSGESDDQQDPLPRWDESGNQLPNSDQPLTPQRWDESGNQLPNNEQPLAPQTEEAIRIALLRTMLSVRNSIPQRSRYELDLRCLSYLATLDANSYAGVGDNLPDGVLLQIIDHLETSGYEIEHMSPGELWTAIEEMLWENRLPVATTPARFQQLATVNTVISLLRGQGRRNNFFVPEPNIFDQYYLANHHWHNGKLFNDDWRDLEVYKPGGQFLARYYTRYAESLRLTQNRKTEVEFFQTIDTLFRVMGPNKESPADNKTLLNNIEETKNLVADGNLSMLESKLVKFLRGENTIINKKKFFIHSIFAILSLEVAICNDKPQKRENQYRIMRLAVDLIRLTTENDWIEIYPEAKHRLFCYNYLLSIFEALDCSSYLNCLKQKIDIFAIKNVSKSESPFKFTLKQLARGTRAKCTDQSFELQFTEGHGDLLKDVNPGKVDGLEFYPDEWQRDLINIVNSNESAFIVAPTSAGKTFISFYAIKKIIREFIDDMNNQRLGCRTERGQLNALVVFVAPTIPLIQQVTADIHEMIGNNNTYGRPVVGTFTSKQRSYLKDCLVLVCTPIIFDMLIRSPQNVEWAKRLKFVIFDEVHNLDYYPANSHSDYQTAASYLRGIASITCPFLALSATIPNPQQLVEEIQVSSRIPIHLINRKSVDNSARIPRWVGLEYFNFTNEGFVKPTYHLAHILTAMASVDRTMDFPEFTAELQIKIFGREASERRGSIHDFYLTPHEVWIIKQFLDDHIESLNNPAALENYIKLLDCFLTITDSTLLITREKANQFGVELFTFMIKHFPFTFIRSNISSKLFESFESEREEAQPKSSEEKAYALIEQLVKQKLLPTLCFDSFNLVNLETKFQYVVKTLQTKGKGKPPRKIPFWPELPTAYQIDNQQNNNAQEEITFRMQRKRERARRLNQMKREFIDSANEIPEEGSLMQGNVPDSIFFWLEKLLKKIIYGEKVDPFLLEGLKRGVAIYNSALPKPYKDLVEILFRSGAIGVVFTTNSLAFGINMPCKSVVLLNPTICHHSTLFEHIQGRTGRRGFDKFGKVIFNNFSHSNISKLLFSSLYKIRLPPIIDTSVILSLLTIYHQKDLPRITENASAELCERLMSFPNSSVDANFVNYSLEMLLRLKLINLHTQPIGFVGLVLHVQEIFPYNYFLTYFLMRHPKYLTEVCCAGCTGETISIANLRPLLHFLAHFVFPLPSERNHRDHFAPDSIIQEAYAEYIILHNGARTLARESPLFAQNALSLVPPALPERLSNYLEALLMGANLVLICNDNLWETVGKTYRKLLKCQEALLKLLEVIAQLSASSIVANACKLLIAHFFDKLRSA